MFSRGPTGYELAPTVYCPSYLPASLPGKRVSWWGIDISRVVKELKTTPVQDFIPLAFAPGEAIQVDLGYRYRNAPW